MGFDPRRWRPSSTARPITGALEALQAENDALRREVRSLRLQLELLLAGRDGSAATGTAAGRWQASRGRPASGERTPPSPSHGLSPAVVERWSAALARHPRWHGLRLGPPGGLRGLLEQLRSRSWPSDLSLEQQLDRRAAGLGTELAAALRGPHSRGRLAVRAAFAFYGPRASEWLNEEPLRVVEELLRQIEHLGPAEPGQRRGTRTENHSQSGEARRQGRCDSRSADAGSGGGRAGGNARASRSGSAAGPGRSAGAAADGHRARAAQAEAETDPGDRSRTGHETAAEPDGSHGAGRGASGAGSASAGASRQDRAGAHQTRGSGAEEGGSRHHREPGGGGGAGHGRQAEKVRVDLRRQALALLGLESDASPQAIKRAYRRLAKAHHPDLGGDVEAFHRLDAAYRLLL